MTGGPLTRPPNNISPIVDGRWSPERDARIPEYKAQIVSMLRSGMFVAEIGEELNIRVSRIEQWRKVDLDFSEACADAEAVHIDTLEREAIRRGRDGYLDLVVYKGELVMDPRSDGREPLQIRKYSDALLQFVLKGRRREVYGDRVEMSGNLRMDVAVAREELQRKIARIAESQTEESDPRPAES